MSVESNSNDFGPANTFGAVTASAANNTNRRASKKRERFSVMDTPSRSLPTIDAPPAETSSVVLPRTAEQIGSRETAALLRRKFPYLQDAVPDRRTFLRPLHRLGPIRDIDDVKPAQLLFRIRIRSIQHPDLAIFRAQVLEPPLNPSRRFTFRTPASANAFVYAEYAAIPCFCCSGVNSPQPPSCT